MRRARLKAAEDQPAGYYHCLSRVVDRRFILEETEKEHFLALMRECEAFCEVRVLTYCVMSNHFHILAEVPKRPEVLPSAKEVIAKLRRLSGHQNVGAVEQQIAMYRKAKDEAGEAEYLASFHARMWDVSAFMKLLKQRFTQWYNGRTGRKGTLWEDRFKSVLVEGAGEALEAMAAYIDLNPVRAGLVGDPKAYRWSGYGAAMAGKRRAKEGLGRVLSGRRREESLSESLAAYRVVLYNEGSEQRESVGEDGRLVRGALRHEEVLEVLKAKGRLGLGDYVRCRVRYFCDGAVLGSRGFVEEVFRKNRGWFGERRKAGARKMRGLGGLELFTVRDLRVNVFG
jgi:REP element-mobilizing transposase RayT